MFITIHAAAGAIIGKKTASSLLAFLLGLISHFILDTIPHGDQHLGKKFFGLRIKKLRKENDFKTMALYGSLDTFFLAVFLIFLFRTFEFADTDSAIWAIIGAILPDVIVVIHKLTQFPPLKWFYKLHKEIHGFLIKKFEIDLSLEAGILMQITIMIVLILTIYCG